jgi:hypothetical protein
MKSQVKVGILVNRISRNRNWRFIMALIVLIPMFIATFIACTWALGDLGPAKYLSALGVALLCVIAVARQPNIIGLLEISYQALAITMLAIGLIWVFLQLRKG